VSQNPGRKDPLVFGSPLIGEEEIDEVVATVRSGWLGTGPRVARLERAFAAYKGGGHALALSSCSAALHIAMLICEIEPGDEVITCPLTFAATAHAIVHAGATPVFADCDRRTMTIDPGRVRAAITPRTKAIIVIHFAGRPCEMDELSTIASEHQLKLIEDCAHAIETVYRGRKAGTIGDVGCFSFHVTKNVITGEGGMLLTAEQELCRPGEGPLAARYVTGRVGAISR